MNDTIDTKTCTKCGNTYPATTEYFHVDKSKKDGLVTRCKTCRRENQNKKAKYNRKYYQANQVELLKNSLEYQKKNQERLQQYQSEYRKKNLDKIRERGHLYRQINQEKIQKYDREYRQANPEKMRVNIERRRARKRQLPDTFTYEQWIICLEYHHYCCAVCGKQLRDLLGEIEPHADHWIPLSSSECTGTVPTNMICLCSDCNLSKGSKMPDFWLKQRYGTRKANEILKRVDAYFEWIFLELTTSSYSTQT